MRGLSSLSSLYAYWSYIPYVMDKVFQRVAELNSSLKTIIYKDLVTQIVLYIFISSI